MEATLSKTPEIEDRQLNPNDKPKLPEGVIITAGEARITDKGIALELFDKDYSVFIVDENGESMYINSREDIENHNGEFTCSSDEIRLYLAEKENSAPELKATKKEETEKRQEEIAAEISELTGISLVRINALPADIREKAIDIYARNVDVLDQDELVARINAAVYDKSPSMSEWEQVGDPREIEKLMELNTPKELNDPADRPANTAPSSEKQKKPSILAFLKEHSSANNAARGEKQL